ncbi:unnamed protein product [Dicrocoelium dendriticum]|nr:unnamed protein product [Dicrocoelium dendriticum]
MVNAEPGSLDFNLLLDEIESGSTGSISNVIRKLREHEVAAYKAGVGGPTGELVARYISALDARAAERNSEIQKTCAYHYQGFVDATRELIEIQYGANKMQESIRDLDSRLEYAVKQYTDSCSALSNCKVTLENVNECISALNMTLPMLEQYLKIGQSIAEGRYYHALRTLEDLEHTWLQRLRPYAFSEFISRQIPKLRTEIKSASLAGLTDFLENIRKHSVRLGLIAMRDTGEATGMDNSCLVMTETEGLDSQCAFVGLPNGTDTSLTDHSTVRKQSSSSNAYDPNLAALNTELEDLERVISNRLDEGEKPIALSPALDCNEVRFRTEDLVDFGPVYRCLYIHTVLNERGEFERYYCAQRRKQCQLSLSISSNKQATMRNYGEFFGSICGFFVVDDYLRRTLPGQSASYKTYLDELWSATVDRLVEFARINSGACLSAKDLIRLKDYTVLFNRTMASLAFPTAGLSEMITWIQRRYQHLLANQWREKFEQIMNEDTFSPIKIDSPEDLVELTRQYPHCITPDFNALPYPKQLCYSRMVPRIYSTMQEYVDLCLQFCAHVDVAYSELEDTVNRATNALFTDCLNAVLHSHVRQSERVLPRLIQFCINLEELEAAYGHLGSYIQQLLPSPSIDEIGELSGRMATSDHKSDTNTDTTPSLGITTPPRSRLHGASLLKDIHALVESLIYGHLNARVDEFIAMIDYSALGENIADGVVNGEHKLALKPNEHIVDLISWLVNTFEALSNIPPKVAQTACISVCKRIANALYDLLLNSQPGNLTDMYILQLSTDLNHCENFVRSHPVPGLDRNVLFLIFTDLRQLLDLFRRDDWIAYVSSRNKPGNPYDRVPPNVALKLLERVRDGEKKRSGFLNVMRKEERDRRKKIDDVIRQLRDINFASRQ